MFWKIIEVLLELIKIEKQIMTWYDFWWTCWYNLSIFSTDYWVDMRTPKISADVCKLFLKYEGRHGSDCGEDLGRPR